MVDTALPKNSMLFMDLDSEDEAMLVAQEMANKLQKVVTVRAADGRRSCGSSQRSPQCTEAIYKLRELRLGLPFPLMPRYYFDIENGEPYRHHIGGLKPGDRAQSSR